MALHEFAEVKYSLGQRVELFFARVDTIKSQARESMKELRSHEVLFEQLEILGSPELRIIIFHVQEFVIVVQALGGEDGFANQTSTHKNNG